MNYTKMTKQFVCKMAMPLALMFAACSNGDEPVSGGSAEETGIYALAGRVGDVVPQTLTASRRSPELQESVKASEVKDSSRDSSVAKQAYMGTLFATKGTVVSIYELDSLTLEKTGRYYADTIDNDSGKFSFKNIELASPYVLIETLDSCETAGCSERGAWYMRPHFEIHIEYPCFKLDDGSNSSGCNEPEKLSKFPLQLSAIVDLRKQKNVSVNSLTDAKVPLLKKYAAEGLSFDEANKKAEREILDFLGVYEELKNFEKVDDEESELAFVRELALIVAKSAFDVRFDLDNGDVDLFFESSEYYKNEGGELERAYLNAIKMIYYKVGFLAKQNDLGMCTESRENEMKVVRGLHDSLMLVCRSEKWTLGFRTMEHSNGTMTDSRDGKNYKTVTYKFGDVAQTWMAENFGGRHEWIEAMKILNEDIKVFTEKKVPGSSGDTTFLAQKCLDAVMKKMESCETANEDPSPFAGCTQNYGGIQDSGCIHYNGYSDYGWTWNYADFIMETNVSSYQGICPDGWRIPTSEDWKILLKNMGKIYGADADKAGVFLYDDVATGFGMKVATSETNAWEEWDNSFVVADAPNYFAYFSNHGSRFGLPLEKIELYVYTSPAYSEPPFYKRASVRCIKN